MIDLATLNKACESMNKLSISTILLFAVLLAGCSQDTEVNVNFTQFQDLKSGDPVKLNGVEIGEVVAVENLDQGVEVVLELDPEKSETLTTSSAAMVITEPERYLELYANTTGAPLESGAQIQGLNNPVDLATWTAGNALGSLQGLATSAASAFNQFLNDSNWDDVANQLNNSLSELNKQSADTLNQLGSELEEFIKQMQEQSTESLKQAEELSRKLDEQLQLFQQQGQEDIARALQNMLDAFNSTLDPNALPPDAGKGEPL